MLSSGKEVLDETEIKELKESLVNDIKELLLKDIDVSEIKNILLTEIDVKDLFFDRRKSNRMKKVIATPSPTDSVAEDKNQSKDLAETRESLVETLKDDHQEILFLYDRIMEKSRERSYTTLPVLLARLSTKCLYHFNNEEELYSDMRKVTNNRSEFEKKIAAEFNQEMNDLSLSISSTLREGNNIPVNDDTVNSFINEFSRLGKKLNKIIKREEIVLFPMYEKSYEAESIS